MDRLKVNMNLNVLIDGVIKKEYQDTEQSSRGTQRVKQSYFNTLNKK
ncbi:hypothetical protein [Clostridium perfringens]